MNRFGYLYSWIRLKGLVALSPFTLVILSLVMGCNPVDQSMSDSTPAWSATLSISGGFAGLRRTITVDQSGQVVYTDRKKGAQVKEQVSPEDLQIYAKQLKELASGKPVSSRNSQCRDCFSYTLVTTYEGKQQRRETDSITVQDSDAKALIKKLATLVSEINSNK